MSFFKKSFTALTCTGLLLSTFTASADQIAATPNAQPAIIPAAPTLDAKGYVLMDAFTGQVLASKNPDKKMAPASLTKLMTLYIVFSELKNGTIHENDKVTISKEAWHTPGSRMFIKAGEEIPVSLLIQGVIVDSGNDATVALAEYIAGSKNSFVDMMNIQAQQLGLSNTHFTDPTGLPNENHYTTPMDLATLARAIITTFPNQYHYFSEKWFTYNDIKQPNRNRLLWRFKGTDGLKTGHTEAAGFCLISSAKREDTRMLSVVMGAPTDNARAEDSIRLLTYGFRFYKTQKVYDANTPLTTQRVWGGEKENISLGLNTPVFVTVPTGQESQIKVDMAVEDSIKAPVKAGNPYGKLTVTFQGNVIASEPLVALNDDDQGGVWDRVSDSVSQSVHHLFHKNSAKAEG